MGLDGSVLNRDLHQSTLVKRGLCLIQKLQGSFHRSSRTALFSIGHEFLSAGLTSIFFHKMDIRREICR